MKHIILSCAFMIWAGISANSQEVVSAELERTAQTNLEDSIGSNSPGVKVTVAAKLITEKSIALKKRVIFFIRFEFLSVNC